MNLDFIEETTTSIAGTLGDGAVTLTALQSVAPGTLRFSNILGTSTARVVRYVIEDITATAGKFERGIGSANNNVLTRTSPRETWDGATYKSTGAAALQFGASPTSGNIRIRCSPVASSLLPTAPFTVTSPGNDFGIISPAHPSGAMSATTFVNAGAGSCPQYYAPWYWTGDGPITQAAIKVLTNVAASHVIFGIYEASATGIPGRLLLGFNQMSTASTGVVKDSTTGTWNGDLVSLLWLPPGWYWLAWQVSSSTIGLAAGAVKNIGSAFTLAGPFSGDPSQTYLGACILKTTVATFGTLEQPATATSLLTTFSGSSENAVPLFGLKTSN